MKKLSIILVAALALAACAKQETVRTARPGEVRFTTNIQTYTVKATDTAFDNGDKVGIFAGTPISKTNVQATVSGTSLIPSTPIKWKEGDNGVVDFFAYYPYADNVAQSYNFAVQADQSTGYAKSDLMLAAKSTAPTENAVELAFKHALSKVVFKVTNTVENTTVNSVAFEGVALGATIDLKTAAISGLDNSMANIKAAKDGNDYKLILVPQTASPKVRVSLSNGKAYVFALASAFEFKAGKKATANLTVAPEAEEGQVEFSFTVSDWEVDDEALVFGDPEIEDAPVDPENSWIVIGKLNGNTWDNPAVINMIEDEYHNWSADITYAAGDEFKLKCGDTWVGMKPDWGDTYGLGDFGDNSNYLSDDPSAKNIVLAAAGEYHLFFAPDTKWFVVTANGGGEDPQPAETGKLTVNVYNGAGWESLNLHMWLEAGVDSQSLTEWPGAVPAATDVVVNEVTYKSFVFDAAPLNKDNLYYILNSNGADDKKTVNLKFPVTLTAAETTVYLELKSDKSVAVIENPATFTPTVAPEPQGDVWVLVGLATDWNTEHELTQDGTDPNLWTISIVLGSGNESGGFKFRLKGKDWDAGQFGVASGNANTFEVSAGTSKEIQLVANDLTSQNIVLTPDAHAYDLQLYVAGDNAGKLIATLK